MSLCPLGATALLAHVIGELNAVKAGRFENRPALLPSSENSL
jgi:hypothetical protein